MIDPQPARMPKRGPHQLGERLSLGADQPPRVERKLRPVLATLVESVRWRADADTAHEQILPSPGIRTAWTDADGKVGDQPDRHPGRQCRLLRRRELLVSQPLKPGVKVRLGAEPGQRSFRDQPVHPHRIGQLGRPATPVGAVHPGKRAPVRPVAKRSPLLALVTLEVGLPAFAQAGRPDQQQRRPFRRPDAVPVDQVGGTAGRLQRRGQFSDLLALRAGQPPVLGNVLDPQVERADIVPGHRQVRRIAYRRCRLGRVQRVNQDEPGAKILRRPGREVSEIAEVAVAPGLP